MIEVQGLAVQHQSPGNRRQSRCSAPTRTQLPTGKRLLASIEKLLRKRIAVERLPTTTDVRQLRLQRTRTAVESLLDDPEAQSRLAPYRDVVDALDSDRDPR
ncbi:MAG: hypothetical protein EBY28_25600, partial [Betaproteobacteria bacterium]|nr:hypothetical protein [Betaproteobacteria bacterium]